MKGFSTMTSSLTKSITNTAVEACRTETRDSCYFPGCKKDANCNCEMCLASINATLDLMPISVQKSSFTKISTPHPKVERTPVTFDPSVLSTPRSRSCPFVMESPDLKSTARLRVKDKGEKKKREGEFVGVLGRFLLGLSFIFGMEIGFSCVVSGVLRPVLTRETVKSTAERYLTVKDLNARLRFMQNELKGSVNGRVSNCSNTSIWEINQDSLLLNSRCVLYKSAVEEVSIWGWPLQTAGLLTTELSSISLTVLSGRVTEWKHGNVGFSIRKANASWVQGKWGASVLQLDPNTWILEYQQSSILENSSLFSAALDLLKHRMSRLVRRTNEQFWLFSALDYQISRFAAKQQLKIPT